MARSIRKIVGHDVALRVAKRLRELREAAGFSQREVTEWGVAPQWYHINNWENGKGSPTPDDIRRLLEVYGVSIGDFCSSIEMPELSEYFKE